MRHIVYSLFLLLLFMQAHADEVDKGESTVRSFDDYVKIRYMPSRTGFLKNEPITEFISESRSIIVKNTGKVMSTNKSIKRLHERAKQLADRGKTSNQRFFHVSFTKIEISYMGKKISLDYVGKTDVRENRHYERAWRELYQDVYAYLTRDITSP